jgi:hypothetical protein
MPDNPPVGPLSLYFLCQSFFAVSMVKAFKRARIVVA